MSGKVKITAKQEEGIKSIKNSILKNIVKLTEFPGRFLEEERVLSELEPSVIESAVFEGYEVEPEFNYGDWVATPPGRIGTIYNFNQDEVVVRFITTSSAWMKDEIRHATPSEIAGEKERRWWRKHGRDVWELKEDDVVKGKGYTTNLWRLGFVKRHYSNVIVLEDISDGSEIEVHKDLSYVVSFKESRLDVKANE